MYEYDALRLAIVDFLFYDLQSFNLNFNGCPPLLHVCMRFITLNLFLCIFLDSILSYCRRRSH